MAGLGVELQRREHKVALAASPAWPQIGEDAGLDFAPIGRPVGFEEFRDHPEIFGRMPFGLRAALGRFLFDHDLACRAVLANGHRALAVTGPAAWTRPESPDVYVTDFVPFSTIASACSAAIHHAGAGTTKSLVRAGIPQLAVPRAFDQPDTARELTRLGVAIQVPWDERRARLDAAVAQLLQSEELRNRALHVAATLGVDGAVRAADAVEHHLE